MKRVTIKDIAKIAGVSYATVSRALGNSPEISQTTRARILEICEQEGYYANSLAKGLVNNRSYVLGLIVPDVSNTFFSEIALEVETYARNQGYHIILCNSNHDAQLTKESFEFLISHQAAGIILASSHPSIQQLVPHYASRVPTILLGTYTSNKDDSFCHSVSLNNYTGGKLAAEYLHLLHHQQVVYLGHRPDNPTHAARLAGFMQTAQKLGLCVKVITNTLAGHSSIECGYQLSKSFLELPFTETAVFAATDSTAMGVMQAADELNLSIPEDLSLIGFDNCSYANLPKIHLTTIDQCKKEQATQCIDLLLKIIHAGEPSTFYNCIVEPKLHTRNTCIPHK